MPPNTRPKAKPKTQPKPQPSKWAQQAARATSRNQTTVAQAKANVAAQTPKPRGPAVMAREVGPQIAGWAMNQVANYVAPPYKGGTPSLGTAMAGQIRQQAARVSQPQTQPQPAARNQPLPSTMPDTYAAQQQRNIAPWWASQDWMQRAQQRAENPVYGTIGRKALLPSSPQGYTNPLGAAPLGGAGGGYSGGYYGGGVSGVEPSYPGSSYGAYAGGRGANPMRGQVPRWWHTPTTWRF